MGTKGHDTRDIFPDFKTYVYPPLAIPTSDPKEWGYDATWSEPGSLIDSKASFVTNGVQIGDSCYLISPIPRDTFVTNVADETHLALGHLPPAGQFPVLYKVGHDHQHTIQTLAQIVGARAITHLTIHHGKLWTGVPMPDWAPDETGEVYIIGHDTRKALWLDGLIELDVGFPGPPPGPPPVPLHIDDWEDRFPGEPRPDYPPGLEPGGDLRAALVADHGTLLAAHEAKSKVRP